MVENDIITNPTRTATFTGNGTNQNIIVGHNQFNSVRITRDDMLYIIIAYRGKDQTKGMVAVGTQENYRTVTITEGGITFIDGGISVGNHIGINEDGHEYYVELI